MVLVFACPRRFCISWISMPSALKILAFWCLKSCMVGTGTPASWHAFFEVAQDVAGKVSCGVAGDKKVVVFRA